MSHDDMRAKILATLDLFEAGVDMKRQALRREHPDETAEQIEAPVGAWLLERPGAEHGDGRPAGWSRGRGSRGHERARPGPGNRDGRLERG